MFLVCPKLVYAGFGISPPYVKNNQLFPGSSYTQEIILLRSDAEEDLQADISVNAPEIKDWITIDKGNHPTINQSASVYFQDGSVPCVEIMSMNVTVRRAKTKVFIYL